MVEISDENGQLIVRIAGQEFTRYQYGSPRLKPYLYPLRAANGLSLLADAPTDHRNHHGLWVGHGRVNDGDFWLERHNSGAIVHASFEEITSGKQQGLFTALSDWVTPEGEVILRDTRTFTFYNQPSEARTFDFEIVLHAPDEKPVVLNPTNESGIPHIRLAEGLTTRTGGTILNAEGKTGERGTYKQRSNWLDCSGKLGRQICGIACFNHPHNPQHPTPWFTRDYGTFSPNYGFFQEDPIVISQNTPLRLRYRFYTHTGNAAEGLVADAWSDYEELAAKENLIAV